MTNYYHILGKTCLISQIFLWIYAFYFFDFEILSQTVLKQKFPINYLYLFSVIFLQVLFFRNFYYAATINSFVKEEKLDSLEEPENLSRCKKCNFLRKKRAHHCRYCNRCIEVMDHHCFSLNQCVGQNNYRYFIGYIFSVEINSGYIFVMTFLKFLKIYNKLKFIFMLKYVVFIFVSFITLCGMFFLLLFHVYLSVTDLTTLEFNYEKLRVDEIKNDSEKNSTDFKNSLINGITKVIDVFCP